MAKNFSCNVIVLYFLLFSSYRIVAQSLPENPEIYEFSGTMKFLSSEVLHGREAGSENALVAADFLAAVLQSYGLKPAGDNTTGGLSYFQEFEVVSYKTHSASLSLIQGEKHLDLTDSIDFKAVPFPDAIAAKGEVVFAGYGIDDAQTGIDNFAQLNLEGKIVMVLDNFPGCHDTLSPSWKNYARFKSQEDSLLLAKMDHAASAGAVAMVLLSRDTLEKKDYYTDADHFILPDPPDIPIPLFRLTIEGFDKLTGFSGMDVDKYEKTAAENPAAIVPAYPSLHARMLAKTDRDTLKAYNVLGLIPGKDPERSIIVGAHYDHLGQRGDSIYSGADDNASGTAGVLALAKNWAESRVVPAYNLIFAFWSAEEKGMLGSTFYVIHNQLNTSNTLDYLNFDMISRKDDTDSTQISIGMLTGTDGIEKMAVAENEKLPHPFRLDLWHTSGHGGSDYVAFVKQKIPVMSFFSGFTDDYHTPRDVFERTDRERMKMILQLANQCLIRLALPVE
jgi:hypothetical protein